MHYAFCSRHSVNEGFPTIEARSAWVAEHLLSHGNDHFHLTLWNDIPQPANAQVLVIGGEAPA